MNTVYCSEMWRHANGYNRHYRIKVLLNVDEGIPLRHTVSKLNERRKAI